MTTLPTVVGASFALVIFVFLANLVLVQYARGVAVTAVDEAVRRASVADSPVDVCSTAGAEVFNDLLGGSFGRSLALECWESTDLVHASVEGTVPALVPLLPGFRVAAEAASLVAASP